MCWKKQEKKPNKKKGVRNQWPPRGGLWVILQLTVAKVGEHWLKFGLQIYNKNLNIIYKEHILISFSKQDKLKVHLH